MESGIRGVMYREIFIIGGVQYRGDFSREGVLFRRSPI